MEEATTYGVTGHKDNPYVGPRPFWEARADLFFGREREARDLLAFVIAERLVLFYAQSGAGKSSLCRARLVPDLRRRGFDVQKIGRVGGVPAEGEVDNVFVFNLLSKLDEERLERDPSAVSHLAYTTIPEYFKPGQDGDHIPRVLIIDQFEEILTHFPERWQQRQGFFLQLNQAIRNDPLLWAVLVMREDQVAALEPYARLLPDRLRFRFYMQRMGAEAALKAIMGPAESYGRPFEPGAAETLRDNLLQMRIHRAVRGVAEEKEAAQTFVGEFVEPVQLQVVCYQLWEKLKKLPAANITARDVEKLGDVDEALADFYEQAIADVLSATDHSESEIRNWFEQKLITVDETRGTVYQGPRDTGGLDNDTVRILANNFLLRSEPRAGGTWYELGHDRFVAPILQSNQAWRSRLGREEERRLAEAHLQAEETRRLTRVVLVISAVLLALVILAVFAVAGNISNEIIFAIFSLVLAGSVLLALWFLRQRFKDANDNDAKLQQYKDVIEILTIVVIVAATLLLALTRDVEPEVAMSLLSGIAGYVLGRSARSGNRSAADE